MERTIQEERGEEASQENPTGGRPKGWRTSQMDELVSLETHARLKRQDGSRALRE